MSSKPTEASMTESRGLGIRPDNRLEDLPMTPVECQECRAVVGVRKASWQQTSIQWDSLSTRICPALNAMPPGAGTGPPSTRYDEFKTCDALRESIAQAALSGDLAVAQG